MTGTSAAIEKMYTAAAGPVCKGVGGAFGSGSNATSGSGNEYRANNMSAAVRCSSISDQLGSCVTLAVGAGTDLELRRTGQTTFAELENEVDNARSGATNAAESLGLAETALANVSPDQLARDIYKQCASYVH